MAPYYRWAARSEKLRAAGLPWDGARRYNAPDDGDLEVVRLARMRVSLARALRRLGRWRKPLLSAVIAAGILYGVFGLWVPSRFITIAPGPARDVATLVVPEGGDPGTGPPDGRFLLTTILASSATPVELWKVMTDPLVDLLPRWAVIPRGMSDETYVRWGEASMRESQLLAAWQAWTFLGNDVELVSDGVEVYFIARGSPAAGRLEEGDRIVAWSMAGRSGPALMPEELERDLVEAFIYGPGRTSPVLLTLDLVRDGSPVRSEFPVGIDDLAAWPFLGLALGACEPATVPPVPVTFPPSDIGGPSGGLMMTLQIVDFFAPESLTAGKVIAGSGTISPGGRVGPVGSIEKKISGAVSAGATVFLVPGEDYPAAATAVAQQGLGELVLIAVGSLTEAHQALVSLTLENTAGYNSADLARMSRTWPVDLVAVL